MHSKKNLFTALIFVLSFSYSSFSQTAYEKVMMAVEQGEEIWNTTLPDKSFLSEGSTMEYGLGYLKAGNFTSAAWSFEEILRKNQDNAFANYFMGCVSMGLNDYVGAQKFFDKSVQLNTGLKSSVPDLAKGQNITMAKKTEVQPQNDNLTIDSIKQIAIAPEIQPEGINHYKVGDKVEVTYGGGWWPGVVTKVEGQDKSVYVSVDFLFQNANRSGGYAYNGVRPYTGQTTTYTTSSKVGGPLLFGDYVLTLGLGISPTKKGFFNLGANGTYSYNGVKGKYVYNPDTGNITWISGTFFNWGKNTSSFTRGKRVAQIDMTYTTKSGTLYYSAGQNLN